jgi:hypothetical protein
VELLSWLPPTQQLQKYRYLVQVRRTVDRDLEVGELIGETE